MTQDYLLTLMALDKPVNGYICEDEAYKYFIMGCGGYLLMYRKKLYKDGRRCYYLTDELARALGFANLWEMKWRLPRIQYWRRFVSVERLRIALQKFHQNQEAMKIKYGL